MRRGGWGKQAHGQKPFGTTWFRQILRFAFYHASYSSTFFRHGIMKSLIGDKQFGTVSTILLTWNLVYLLHECSMNSARTF